jgi:hypothetical protein
VTASEFAFLAMGLILGVAAGAALIEFIRARPPSPREVRLTMAPDAVPRRRASTLANDAFTDSPVAADPAHMGPADRLDADRLDAERLDAPDDGSVWVVPRTPVLDPVPGTVAAPPFRLAERPPDRTIVTAQGVPVSSGVDPMLTALRASAAASAEAAMAAGPSRPSADTGSATASAGASTATAVRASDRDDAPTGGDAPTAVTPGPKAPGSKTTKGASKPATAPPSVEPTTDGEGPPGDTATGPCGEARRLADERCELASRARAQATEAEEAHRAAQRAYDDHEAEMTAATAAVDARAIRQAKDEAQARFRVGRAAARSPEQIEAAARDWLQEINRINAMTGDAHAALARSRAAAPGLAVALERSSMATDGARIAAEAAEAACLAARQAVADCEERVAGRLPAAVPTGGGDDHEGTPADTLVAALRAGGSPRIVRMLRGDRVAMQDVVVALGGDDNEERRRWQIAMSDLVDAILSDAIAASALDFPSDHPFWGPFSQGQSRDITSALSSLGYRFDGLGGWVDERYPSQRDLSLALGYAGLDPMRMRHWPNDAEMAVLYDDVEVAAAEHLAGAAGDMTLGELVSMLGRRADGLTDVWNDWGRVRPLLLDES